MAAAVVAAGLVAAITDAEQLVLIMAATVVEIGQLAVMEAESKGGIQPCVVIVLALYTYHTQCILCCSVMASHIVSRSSVQVPLL